MDEVKALLWHKAVAVDRNASRYPEWKCIGFVWKHPSHTIKWTFTSDIERRTYPVGALFIPVYAERIADEDST